MIKVYRINLKYKIVPTQRESFSYIEFIRVKPDEDIGEVIISIKERMFYDFDNSPLIEGVTYSMISEIDQ
jgi:hypothetical protein